MSILPFTSPTGDQTYDEPFVKEIRNELITLRDGALGQGEFHWVTLLTHTICILSEVLGIGKNDVPAPQVAKPTTYLDRMQTELSEITDRLEKLTAFYNSEAWAALSIEKQNMLCEQRLAMERYRDILAQRVAHETATKTIDG